MAGQLEQKSVLARILAPERSQRRRRVRAFCLFARRGAQGEGDQGVFFIRGGSPSPQRNEVLRTMRTSWNARLTMGLHEAPPEEKMRT